MSRFQDYLASSNVAVNESVDINEADHDIVNSWF